MWQSGEIRAVPLTWYDNSICPIFGLANYDGIILGRVFQSVIFVKTPSRRPGTPCPNRPMPPGL